MSSGETSSELTEQLAEAISPLGVAFDTTLVALSLSVVLGLLSALVQRTEGTLLSSIDLHLDRIRHSKNEMESTAVEP